MSLALVQSAAEQLRLDRSAVAVQPLTGGCIHRVLRITLDDGSHLVAKIASAAQAALFEEESHGLHALAASQSVLVPAPLGIALAQGQAVFIMEAITPAAATEQTWIDFGNELASLHARDAGSRYGFAIHNHLGTTPQPNDWCDDWVEFNAEHRLGHQLRLAHSAARLQRDEAALIQRVIDQLESLIPRQPKPALLHGDLWSGNALPAQDHTGRKRIALIDPAPSIGDGWADIAMMELFGGFPRACCDAYAARNPDQANIRTRIGVYQLYHILNHINIFGRSYAAQAINLAQSLTR